MSLALFCTCTGDCDLHHNKCQTPLLLGDFDEVCKTCREGKIWKLEKKCSNRISGVVHAVTHTVDFDKNYCICENGRNSHCQASSH